MADIPIIRASTQVLTNSDLLHCIVNLIPLEWEYEKNDLARLAVVSRAFYDPAIRALWRTLGTMFPLWHLLAPLDASFPYFPRDDSRSEYLQKVSAAKLYDDPARWDRFLWYTSHIHNLSYVADPLAREVNHLHLHLLRSVVTKNGGHTVLPLLRSINWSEDITAILRDSSLSPLFTTTLRYACIFLGPDHLANVSSLRRLHECSPFLEIITLDADFGASADLSLVRELASFDRLREIRLPSLSETEAFQELLAQPNLTSLSVFEVVGPWVGLAQSASVSHLLELDVCASVPCLTSLFEHTRFEALRIVQFNCVRTDAHCRIADMIPVLEALRGAVSPGSLQNITIFSGWYIMGEDKPALRTVLAPILSLRSIRAFSFLCPVDVMRYEDEDIDALARAWPHLERLSLYSGIGIGTAVSLAAVHHLYARCPALEEVSLPCIRCPVIGVHAIPGPESDRIPPHPLKNLFIGEIVYGLAVMTEGAAEGLVRYFLDLFPRLEDRTVLTRSGPLRIPSAS